MDTFPKNLIRKHVSRFNRGIKRVKEKRSQWDSLVSLAKPIMDEVVSEAKTQNLFEHLYLLNSLEIAELSSKLPMLQISFGQHPVGYNENLSNKLVVESGCTLTFVQLVSGHVVCTIYPFQSQLRQRNEKYIIAYIFSAPNKIKKRHLQSLLKSLFSYAQISSVYGEPMLSDWFRVYWLKAEHWWLHFKLGDAAKNLLDKVIGVAVEKNAGI